MKELTKEEKIFFISIEVLKLEARFGHMKWKVTELVKNTKVSRTLIYRYFGSNKMQILTEAFKIFIYDFYGLNQKPQELSFLERLTQARDLISKNPELILFYQKTRSSDNFLKEEIIKIEKLYQKKLLKLFPELDDKSSKLLHAFIHGLVNSPFLTSEQLKSSVVNFHENIALFKKDM